MPGVPSLAPTRRKGVPHGRRPRARPGPVARPFVEFRPLLRAARDRLRPEEADPGGAWACSPWLAGWAALDRALRRADLAGSDRDRAGLGPSGASGPLGPVAPEAGRRMTEPFRAVVGPFCGLFSPGIGPARLVPGGADGPLGGRGLGDLRRGDRADRGGPGGERPEVGVGSALRFALRKSGSLIGAPLTPMVAVAIFAALCGRLRPALPDPRGDRADDRRGPRVRPAAARAGDGPDPARAWPPAGP